LRDRGRRSVPCLIRALSSKTRKIQRPGVKRAGIKGLEGFAVRDELLRGCLVSIGIPSTRADCHIRTAPPFGYRTRKDRRFLDRHSRRRLSCSCDARHPTVTPHMQPQETGHAQATDGRNAPLRLSTCNELDPRQPPGHTKLACAERFDLSRALAAVGFDSVTDRYTISRGPTHDLHALHDPGVAPAPGAAHKTTRQACRTPVAPKQSRAAPKVCLYALGGRRVWLLLLGTR